MIKLKGRGIEIKKIYDQRKLVNWTSDMNPIALSYHGSLAKILTL